MAALILSDKTEMRWNGSPFVVRVTSDYSRPESLRPNEALLLAPNETACPEGFRAYFKPQGTPKAQSSTGAPVIPLPDTLSYLSEGDIVVIRPTSGRLRVVYRRAAKHNALMVAAACNNLCLMCSQPPANRDIDDSASLVWEAIPMMDINSAGITFSGGEPTLLGRRLVELIRRAKNFLPYTALHILTNGRLLKYLTFAHDIGQVGHRDLVLGIALYSDVSHEHDFIVQAQSAFDDTVRGILNLARCDLRVEIRVVITSLNSERLPRLAEFIARNFPFTCNVALMGLEPVGYAKANLARVWADPADYGQQLRDAVGVLAAHRLPISIYNHQLCTLPTELWRYSCQSISDWKNIFIDRCSECSARHECGGFFSSSSETHSRAISPIPVPAPFARRMS